MYAPWHLGQTAYTPGRIGPVRPKLLQFGEATLRHYSFGTREWVSVVYPRLAFPKQFSDLVYAVGGRRGRNTRLVVVVGRQDKEHQALPRVDLHNPQATVAVYQDCHFGIVPQLIVYLSDGLIGPELPAQLRRYLFRAGFKLDGAMTGLLTNTNKIPAKHTGIPAGVFAVWTPAMSLVIFERELQVKGLTYRQFVRHAFTSQRRVGTRQ